MRTHLLCSAVAMSCLIAAPAHAAGVRVETTGTNPSHIDQIVTDPLLASIPGRAEADLLGETYKGFAEAGGPYGESSVAAINAFLIPGFTNVSGKTTTLPLGWFTAHIAGDIELSPAPGTGQSDSTQVQGTLSVTYGGVARIATGQQIAATSCPGCADFFDEAQLSIVLPPGFVPDDLQANDGTPGSSFAWLSVAPPTVLGLGGPGVRVGDLALGLSGMWLARQRLPVG